MFLLALTKISVSITLEVFARKIILSFKLRIALQRVCTASNSAVPLQSTAFQWCITEKNTLNETFQRNLGA